jgi:hypothetical protein
MDRRGRHGLTKHEHYLRFCEELVDAAARFKPQYLHFPTATESDRVRRIYRQRVYCYELYHHLRQCWGDRFQFKLSAMSISQVISRRSR